MNQNTQAPGITRVCVRVVDGFPPSCRSHFMKSSSAPRETEKDKVKGDRGRMSWGGYRSSGGRLNLLLNFITITEHRSRKLSAPPLRQRTEECWLFSPHFSLIFISLSTSGRAFFFFLTQLFVSFISFRAFTCFTFSLFLPA